MPPFRTSRASSVPVPSVKPGFRPSDKDDGIFDNHRTDLLVLPRPVAGTLGMREFLRLDAMARFVDPPIGIYNLGAVPVNATWGVRHRDRLLCVDNIDLAVWVIGCLEDVSYDIRPDHKPSLCVKVQLLRECDRTRLASLNRRTSPKSKNYPPTEDLFVATANIPDPQSVFKHFYDGSLTFDFQSNMPELGVNHFVPGDMVLVESSFVRTSYDNWATWSVKFELHALTLLHRAARTRCGRGSRYRGGL